MNTKGICTVSIKGATLDDVTLSRFANGIYIYLTIGNVYDAIPWFHRLFDVTIVNVIHAFARREASADRVDCSYSGDGVSTGDRAREGLRLMC